MKLFVQSHGQPPIKDEEPAFWLSVSDLMTGLVMVFVLVLLAVLHWRGEQHERQQDKLRQREQQALALKKRLATVESRVRAALGVRASLVKELRRHFESVRERVDVDPRTGAIRIGESVLFEFNSSELKGNGKKVVSDVYGKLEKALFRSGFPYKQHLAAISIEGHASQERLRKQTPERIRADYLNNLALSQARAQAVLDFLSGVSNVRQTELRRYAVAVGYGYARPRKVNDRSSPENRRIEITFQLKDEEALEQMRKLLSAVR